MGERKNVKVFPNAGSDGVEESISGELVVRLKAKAKDNKANHSLVKLLSKHYGADVRILSGVKSKRKVVEILRDGI